MISTKNTVLETTEARKFTNLSKTGNINSYLFHCNDK